MKEVIEVKPLDVANLDAVLDGTTNLVVVPFSYLQKINEERASRLKIGGLTAEITWVKWGYYCSVPNSSVILKIKRDIPNPNPENSKTVEFSFEEKAFNPHTLGEVFKGESVVLTTHYFTEENVPAEYKTPKETIQKMQSLNPGDWIVLTNKEGATRRARILSLVGEACPAMKTLKIGRIPYDYASMIFELADVQ